METYTDLYNKIYKEIEASYGPKLPQGNLQPSAASPMDSGGLLFGGMDGGLNEYLSEAQRQAMQRQAMMSAAAALLKSSGRSTTPISVGQALGQGLEAGAAGYQQAQQGAMAQLLTKQKLDEAKRAQQSQLAYQNFLTAQPTVGTEITPQQAISTPNMALGPTVERAAMIGQPAPSVMPSGMSVLSPAQRAMLANLPAEKGIPEMLKLTQPTEKAKLLTELGLQPTLANLRLLDKPEAEPEKIRYLKALNLPITLDNFRKLDKPDALPSEIQILKETNTPVTFENIQLLRKSGASNVTLTATQNAEKKGLELAYEQAVKDLGGSRDMARSANATIANIENILPALDTAIVGPAADTRTTLLRIGKQLNIGGANADQILRNTATVVQGLAQQELDASQQIKGQGSLTESERAILRRAAGGDQSLTSGELRQGLMAAQRTARLRVESHGQLLNTAVTQIPSLSTIAPMYNVPVYGAPPPPNPLQKAIDEEIAKRKNKGGKK
jgi:hypothetical protein